MNSANETILITDDDPQIRKVIASIVEMEGYAFELAASGEEAAEKLTRNQFSLLISDIQMEGMSGVELLQHCRTHYSDMAVIMVTGVDDRTTAIRTLELGAYGYVTKPFHTNELIINIANALKRRALEMQNRRHNEELETLVNERTEELVRSREESIQILSKAAEFRDDETARHNIRIGLYCDHLARLAGFAEPYCQQLKTAAPLHDVGKIGVPDSILLKPGHLTEEEFRIVKTHPRIGHRILSGSTSEILQLGAEIALHHHERFDGSGYPDGLAGNDISLPGRITAICDVFDALTTERVYKSAIKTEKAKTILLNGRATHFDPHLLDLFIENLHDILAIRQTILD